MKKVVILGATGQTGKIVVAQALNAGYAVTAFVRGAEEFLPHKNLIVIKGDARKADDLEFAMGGQDAVISVLGTHKVNDDLITESTNALIKAAHANKVKRIIMMSSFLASGQLKQSLVSWVLAKLSAGLIGDKQTGEELLKSSDLDWTIVYATQLGNGPATGATSIVAKDEKVTASNGIDRADVADFLVAELENTAHIRESLLITTR